MEQELILSLRNSLLTPDTHILIIGPQYSGKSFLLNDIVPHENIIDRKFDALETATSPIDAKAMDRWLIRTKLFFGIDEPNTIRDSLDELFMIAHDLRRSYVVCLQQLRVLPKNLLIEIVSEEYKVRLVELANRRQKEPIKWREISRREMFDTHAPLTWWSGV